MCLQTVSKNANHIVAPSPFVTSDIKHHSQALNVHVYM